MYIHTYNVETNRSVTHNATDTIDLPEAGIMGGLNVRYSVKNTNDVYDDDQPDLIDHITKVEVVEHGDNVLYSLTGRELLAAYYWNNGLVPWRSSTALGNQTVRQDLPIEFGRFWCDPMYPLDLSKLDNPKLKITNNLDTDTATAATCRAEADISVFEDFVGGATQFFKTYEAESETPVKDADYTKWEVPTRHKIRRLMIIPEPTINTADHNKWTTSVQNLFNNIKFTFNQKGKILYDADLILLYKLNAMTHWGEVTTLGLGYGSTSYTIDTHIGYGLNVVLGSCPTTTGTALAIQYDQNYDGRKYISYAGAAEQFAWRAKGLAYMYSALLWDTKIGEEDKLLDPTPYKPIDIEIYNRYDDGECKEVLQILKGYEV